MELKEQLEQIKLALKDFGLKEEYAELVRVAAQAYGNNCYNQALEDAAEYMTGIENSTHSILNLKKH